jgi:uncharacterized membrane protein HdeD (DUF308 family)
MDMANLPQLVQPILLLVAGIVILIYPRLLNYIIALAFVIYGIVGIAGILLGSGG